MQNHYLKAVDAAALRAALIAASILVEAEAGDTLAPGYCLDEIGEIIKPTGNTVTVDGIETQEMAPIAGYHANLLGELSDEQIAALGDVLLDAAPSHPYRVWASA